MIFDEAAGRDLFDALRRHEGHLRGCGRALSPGAAEILRIVSRSGVIRSGQPLVPVAENMDGGEVITLQLLTLEDVADRLQVSLSTVRRLVKSNELVSVTVGPRAVRVRPEDLAEYLEGLGDDREANG